MGASIPKTWFYNSDLLGAIKNRSIGIELEHWARAEPRVEPARSTMASVPTMIAIGESENLRRLRTRLDRHRAAALRPPTAVSCSSRQSLNGRDQGQCHGVLNFDKSSISGLDPSKWRHRCKTGLSWRGPVQQVPWADKPQQRGGFGGLVLSGQHECRPRWREWEGGPPRRSGGSTRRI